MNDERWEQFIEIAREKFRNVEVRSEDVMISTETGMEKRGTEDVLEFDNAQGRFRVVRENRPVVLEKKEHYSHRQGDTARTEYIVSNTEYTHNVKVFREVDIDEWEEISADQLGL